MQKEVMIKLKGKFVPLYIHRPSCNSSHWKSNPSWESNTGAHHLQPMVVAWYVGALIINMSGLIRHAAMWSIDSVRTVDIVGGRVYCVPIVQLSKNGTSPYTTPILVVAQIG
jgi:hypothetical protein